VEALKKKPERDTHIADEAGQRLASRPSSSREERTRPKIQEFRVESPSAQHVVADDAINAIRRKNIAPFARAWPAR